MVLCLVLSVKREPKKSGESGGRRLSTVWLLLALLAMAFNGGVGILQKTHQSSAHKAELPAFLFVAFAFCAVFSAFCYLFLAIRARKKRQENGGEEPTTGSPRFSCNLIVLFLLSGVCVALCHCINLYLSGVVAAAVFFPIVNGGALMLTTLASLLLFHERLSLTQWLGLALGAVATLLLCL